MKATLKKKLPQEGVDCTAVVQSLTDATASVFPSYSGGGKERPTVESEQSDSSMITAGSRESPPPMSCTKKRPCSKEKSCLPSDDSSSGEEVSTVRKVVTPKRGRGRPPTTGQYVGLRKAKEDYLRLQRKEMEMEAERDLEEQIRERQKIRNAHGLLASPVAIVKDTIDLRQEAVKNLELVCSIATRSKNLKGTFQRALKDAASSIRACVDSLVERNTTEETRQLKADNFQLKSELAELRKEVAQLRADREGSPKIRANDHSSAVNTQIDIGELSNCIMTQLSTMMNARLEALEEMLLPKKQKNRKEKSIVSPVVSELHDEVPGTLIREDLRTEQSKPKGTKKRRKHGNAQVLPIQTQSEPCPQSLVPASEEAGWVKVTRRRAKHKNPVALAGKERAKGKAANLRLPRSAAIVLTLQPGASERGVSYASVLRQAKTANFSEIGLDSFRVRKTATGARVLEIPGPANVEKADEVTKRLKATLNLNDVRVSRVTKCAELRISELDDSVTKEEVVTAISQLGGCAASQIKTGELRTDNSGLLTIWIRCPVAVAKMIAENGRLLIGWVSAKARLLDQRTRRCYRCLEIGHVKELCKSETDRSRLCFRCGLPDHKANVCQRAPHCVLCADLQRPSGHKIGSKFCSSSLPTNPRKGPNAKSGAVVVPIDAH